MNIELKNLPNSEVEMKIRVPWKEWEKFINKAVSELSKEVKVEGFRPGKVPKNILEQRIGKNVILEQAAQKAVSDSYVNALKEKKVKAIGPPEAKVTKIVEGNDLEYTVKTAVLPGVKLKPYQDEIKKVNKEYRNLIMEVTEKEIEEELKKLADHQAKLITVSRPAQKGDVVIVDFDVFRDGVLIENGSSKNHPVTLGAGVFIPGFEDKVIGMSEKEEKEFDLEFPKEYHDKNLAGRKAIFKVKVNLVQDKQVPELNDELAKSVGDFKDLDALKKSISEGMQKEKESKQKKEKQEKYIDSLVKEADIDLPDYLLQEETKAMIAQMETYLKNTGMGLDDYLKNIKKTRQDLEKENRPEAEKRLKGHLIITHLASDQDIKVENKDIESEMNKVLQFYKTQKDAQKNLNMEDLYARIKSELMNDKVFEYLESL